LLLLVERHSVKSCRELPNRDSCNIELSKRHQFKLNRHGSALLLKCLHLLSIIHSLSISYLI